MEQLLRCRQEDLITCVADDLVDLNKIDICTDNPAPLRINQYLEQVRNPYLFRIDNLLVKVSFTGTKELSSALAGLLAPN
jgi:hypothetical protein